MLSGLFIPQTLLDLIEGTFTTFSDVYFLGLGKPIIKIAATPSSAQILS